MLITQPMATMVFTVAAGIFSLILARKTKLPSVIYLLVLGVLLGPSVLNLIRPIVFRHNFPQYVSLMVALILFEGAASLKIAQLKEISRAVRGLLVTGSLVTLGVVSLAAWAVGGMNPGRAILFGSIMIVSGPTVVIPILRRLRIKEHLHNLLKWEAILIDPIGVITAVVLFELLLVGQTHWTEGLLMFGARLVVGAGFGLVGGWVMHQALVRRWLLKMEGEELGGLFLLAANLFVFGLSEWVLDESGFVAVTVAGIFIGNAKFPFKKEIFRFKEQVTLFALSVLFILISSNVPLGSLHEVWKPGLAILALMIFAARPLSVLLSTAGDRLLTLKEKLFLSLVAPRGIVSASLASLFALEFEEKALAGRGYFLPLSFIVIAGTILFYGLLSGLFARICGVEEEDGTRVVIVGANELGLLYAEQLRERGISVNFIDTNPLALTEARRRGFTVFLGNAFDPDFIESLDLKGIGRMLALTSNHQVNVLCCQAFARYLRMENVYRIQDRLDLKGTDGHEQADTGGRPLIASHLPGLDLSELAEWGNYRIEWSRLPEAVKVTPDALAAMDASFPLFAVSGQAVTFVAAGATLAKGSDLCRLKPTDPR